MVKAADLNRRVTLQSPVRAANGQGGNTKSWQDVLTVWAQMIPLRGAEAMQQNLLEGSQLWKVTIRHRVDINTDWRLMYGTMAVNIRSCQDPDGTREWLVMTGESGVKT